MVQLDLLHAAVLLAQTGLRGVVQSAVGIEVIAAAGVVVQLPQFGAPRGTP